MFSWSHITSGKEAYSLTSTYGTVHHPVYTAAKPIVQALIRWSVTQKGESRSFRVMDVALYVSNAITSARTVGRRDAMPSGVEGLSQVYVRQQLLEPRCLQLL